MATPLEPINAQYINSMTPSQMASLKDADGKIPALANQLIITDEEDVNLSQLRTEIVYDMTSSDANKNWDCATGIKGGVTISGKDFSKYSKLIIHTRQLGLQLTLIYEMNSSASEQSVSGLSADNLAVMTVKCSATNTSFSVVSIGYWSSAGSFTNRNANDDYIVTKIEGILNDPAIVYTGMELHGGNGISIEDGVISQTIISKARSSVIISGGRSFTGLNYQTVASFTITTKGGRILASYCIPLYTSGNVAYTAVHVDGANYGQEVRMTGSTARHLSNTVITPELSPGVHTVQLVVRGQKDSNTLTIPSYETGYLLGAEV